MANFFVYFVFLTEILFIFIARTVFIIGPSGSGRKETAEELAKRF